MKALSVGSFCSKRNQGGRSGEPDLEAINLTGSTERHNICQTLFKG